jgi:hypothetical protein
MLTRRTPWVLALTVALLLSAIDLHPAGELHDVLGGAADAGSFSQSAKHPNAPAHFEQFEAGQRPVCPICLHQLRTGGAHLPVAAHLHAPSLAGFHGLISTPLLREHCAAPRGARGPPSV